MMRNELKTLYYLLPVFYFFSFKNLGSQSEINIPPPFWSTPKKQNMTHLIECTCYLVTSKHTQISFSLTLPLFPSLLILKHIMFILQNNRFKCFFPSSFLAPLFILLYFCFISYCSLSYKKAPKFALKMFSSFY